MEEKREEKDKGNVQDGIVEHEIEEGDDSEVRRRAVDDNNGCGSPEKGIVWYVCPLPRDIFLGTRSSQPGRRHFSASGRQRSSSVADPLYGHGGAQY